MVVYVLTCEERYCDHEEFSVVKVYSNILSAVDAMREEWEKTLLKFGMNNDAYGNYIDKLSAVVDDGDDIIRYYVEEMEVEE